MRHSWKIGRIFGIDIFVDSSWFLIFILFTWMLGSQYFPQYKGWPAVLYWMMGAFTSLMVFASVLIHELAHSLVAIKHGEKVKNITLFILGGVAQISEEPKEPVEEFVMAVVGPLASFAIGGILFLVSLLLAPLSRPFGAAFFYLAIINVVLAFFNLLPGFPMDGGRVLRSIIWRITGNIQKATRVASLVGQGFAFFFVFIGVLRILSGDLTGVWLIFIAWFLNSAAARSYSQVKAAGILEGVKASDLMTRDFETIPGTISIRALVEDHILKEKERIFLVEGEGRLEGFVCLEDVKRVPRDDWDVTPVRAILTPKEKLDSVSPNAAGNSIMSKMASGNVRLVPVMEGEKLIGIVCHSDILKYIQLRSDLKI
ncbi:MAG: site-2 protease family protein [Candidatus Aminicenantes bacterium]|nr:site-2 protease family protein [Candidatus Aminicenantes bacterium]